MITLMQRRTNQSDQRQRGTLLRLLQELRQFDPQVARHSCPVFGGVAAYHPRPSPSPRPRANISSEYWKKFSPRPSYIQP
jgi:hypothetical protein